MDHPYQVLDQTTNRPKLIAQTVFYLQKWQGPSKEICSNRWNVHLDSNRQPTLWALYSTKQVAVESKYRTKLLPLEAAKTVQTKFRRTLLDQKCSLETEVGVTCRKCSIHGLPVQHVAYCRIRIWLSPMPPTCMIAQNYWVLWCVLWPYYCITHTWRCAGLSKMCTQNNWKFETASLSASLKFPTWNRRNYAAKKYGLFCSEWWRFCAFLFSCIQAGATILSMKVASFLHFFFPNYSWRKIRGEMDKCNVYLQFRFREKKLWPQYKL